MNMAENEQIHIERNRSIGEGHPLAQSTVMSEVTSSMAPKQEMVRLVDYLRDIAGKPRGSETGGKEDLNSHTEELIIKDSEGIRLASLSEFQDTLRSLGANVEVLGVQSIGNSNQRVEAVVQGVNRANPKSGFERPSLIEGPHMILAPYALDKDGQLHVFRTIQYRTGEAEIDTPRGFADSKALENGQKMYDIEGSSERVAANLQRIVGEESGNALQIRRIVYLGAPRVNGSFVPADLKIGEGRSAIFAVEVDYDAFIKSQKVVTEAELQRRREQEEHEGLTGDILDITLPQYADYNRNSNLAKDMAADFGTDTVVIDFLERNLTDLAEKEKAQRRHLSAEGEANRRFKEEDPQGYLMQRLRVSEAKHPENADESKRKAEEYLSKLYSQDLKKAP
jgi:hypothetical protein